MKIENRIKIGLEHFEIWVFLFFVTNVDFDQFWKNNKFQKFANFGINIEPNVDSFGLYFEENIPINDFSWKKKSDLPYFYL